MAEPSKELLSPLLSSEDDEEATFSTGLGSSGGSSNSKIPNALLENAYNIVLKTEATSGYEDAIDDAFHTLDVENTGKLERADITAFIKTAATHTKLDAQYGESVIEAAVDALIHDAGGLEDSLITKDQFHDIFERHPDMLVAFEDPNASYKRRESASKIMF